VPCRYPMATRVVREIEPESSADGNPNLHWGATGRQGSARSFPSAIAFSIQGTTFLEDVVEVGGRFESEHSLRLVGRGDSHMQHRA